MRNNRPSRPCLWLIAAALWASCWACSLNDPVSESLPSLPAGTPAGILEARAWYESHRQGQGISLSGVSNDGVSQKNKLTPGSLVRLLGVNSFFGGLFQTFSGICLQILYSSGQMSTCFSIS